MVVAASLVPIPSNEDELGETGHGSTRSSKSKENELPPEDEGETPIPIMSDPNFGPVQRRQSSMLRLRRSVSRGSNRIWQSLRHHEPTGELRRVLLWFCLSSLVVAPALVVLTIVALDCYSAALDGVPNLAKLVVIINSCLPGALIVVVLLKSNPAMADSAAAVAKVYLPTYLLSIVTIAAWTTLGLWITVPDEDGNTFCER